MTPDPKPTTPPPTEEKVPSISNVSGASVVGFATLGCLAAGCIGLLRALTAEGIAAGVFLLVSVVAFATVSFIYLGKD